MESRSKLAHCSETGLIWGSLSYDPHLSGKLPRLRGDHDRFRELKTGLEQFRLSSNSSEPCSASGSSQLLVLGPDGFISYFRHYEHQKLFTARVKSA